MAPPLKQPVTVHPLKAQLQKRGITQTMLAKALGVHFVTVNWWMNGREKLPLERLSQINSLLDTIGLEERNDPQIPPHQGEASG
jgi:DNA-binding transcriptional regulator YdaS (Cro superfamily)